MKNKRYKLRGEMVRDLRKVHFELFLKQIFVYGMGFTLFICVALLLSGCNTTDAYIMQTLSNTAQQINTQKTITDQTDSVMRSRNEAARKTGY